MADSNIRAAAAAARRNRRDNGARATKLLLRIEQLTKKPGVYPFAIVVNTDGTWDLIVSSQDGKIERLG